ncbi:maintenance of telomere capping protein 1 [Neurospora intermedia]|uniref:Maintenance of telomere capping protein 1 n=1 Tax=Neurospora intermedia TaxID=5142 RepID=A0ABR3DSD5_NEUIN
MATKRSKTDPTDDELGELFEGIGDDIAIKKSSTPKTKRAPAKPKNDAADRDILAELEDELVSKAPERPHTPRVRDIAARASPAKRTSTNTPPPPAADTGASTRKSGESTASHPTDTFTPSATSSDPHESEKKPAEKPQPAANSGGSWWGGFLSTAASTAAAAVKQAEAAVKEIQQNEEAKKWADQVRGNVGALRGLVGEDLVHRAIPTFTNILHTFAPPISSHERLLIHITHDLVGYPSLDPLIHGVFSRVMSQVEGGDLLVIQRGQESTARNSSEKPSFFGGSSTVGWRDGPWWRQVEIPRDLGVINGLVEGTKLCRANAEGYANDYFAAHGGIEAARQRAMEPARESNPVRTSDIFLSVQAIGVKEDKALFAGSSASEKEKESSDVLDEDKTDDLVCFAVYLFDPIHDIQYSAVSQSIPAKWIRWLDAAAAPLTPGSADEGQEFDFERVPEEIREIVESGGVDPREWVAEWVEEALNLSVGIIAQRYVARRMGVGEGSIGKGKQKVETILEEGGSEAARAGLI